MTPKFMQLLEQCVQDGVILGHKRAYKHNDVHEWFNCDERTGLTVPPRKEWVGLTDEDTANICMQSDINNWRDEQVIDAVQAKLKEKNT
jgi:hypothetical protein